MSDERSPNEGSGCGFGTSSGTFSPAETATSIEEVFVEVAIRISTRFPAPTSRPTETALVLILFCLIPDWFNVLCFTYGILCWFTTIGRVYAAWQDFGISVYENVDIKQK